MRVPLYDIVMMAIVKMKKALREESFGAFVMEMMLYANETEKAMFISGVS